MKTSILRSGAIGELERINPNHRHRVIRNRVAAAVLLLGLVASAQAQEKEALEEVIVTAQKREQKLQDVPTTVNVLSADAMRTSSITEVGQLSALTPGILINNSDTTGRNTQIKIRGVGPDESSIIHSPIGFFYNDIPILNQTQGGQTVASDLDLGDLARVEVLKGPQSTLFGESVSGGAIAFYTRRPSVADGYNGNVSVSEGTLDLHQYRAAFGAPIGDKIAVRISGFDNERQDQVLNTWNDTRRLLRWSGYTLQVLWQPSDDLKFIVEHNRRVSTQSGGADDGKEILAYGPGTIASAAAAGVTLTPPNPFDRRVQIAYPLAERLVDELTSLHATWNINDHWTLTSITGFQANRDRFFGDGPYGAYNASNSITIGFWATGKIGTKIHQTTEELRLDYAGTQLNSLVGVYYAKYRVPFSIGDFGFVYPTFIFPLAQGETFNKVSESIFTNNSFKFTDALETVFGARYTKEKDHGVSQLCYSCGAFSGTPVDLSMFPESKSDVSAWGGTLKQLYHFNDKVSVYAGIDRGFRLGGINNLNQPNYKSEIAYNYEVGLKGLFRDNTLRLNADVYETKYNGYQVPSYDSRTLSAFTQNADVTSKGFEAEVQWLPIRQLALNAALDYNDAVYTHYKGATCDNYQDDFGFCPNDPTVGVEDLSGRRLSHAPLWSGNLSAQYGDSIGPGMDWYLRGEYEFQGASLSHPVGPNGDPRQRLAPYGVVNASVGLSFAQGWKVVLWGKNLLNKNYFTAIIRQPVGEDGNFIDASIGLERTGGITVSYDF